MFLSFLSPYVLLALSDSPTRVDHATIAQSKLHHGRQRHSNQSMFFVVVERKCKEEREKLYSQKQKEVEKGPPTCFHVSFFFSLSLSPLFFLSSLALAIFAQIALCFSRSDYDSLGGKAWKVRYDTVHTKRGSEWVSVRVRVWVEKKKKNTSFLSSGGNKSLEYQVV